MQKKSKKEYAYKGRSGRIVILAAVIAGLSPFLTAMKMGGIELGDLNEKVKFQDSSFTLPLGLQADNFHIPGDNPMTKDKIELGRALFFDVRLSANDTVSCASCHEPAKAFTDNLPVFTGIDGQQGTRNSPTVINRAFTFDQFWDGRAESLEEQAKGPLISPTEMGNQSHDALIEKLEKIKGYRKWFKKVFKKEVNIDDLAKAIAAFERTILSGHSPLDRYNMGDDHALTESAKRGLTLFRGKARCSQCHAGSNLSDEMFHNIGVGWDGNNIDLGRYAITNVDIDAGAFKTPILREVSKTAPYMHNGRFDTLEEVIDFYDKGGAPNPFLDSLIKVLKLKKNEKADLIAFLNSLEGKGWQHFAPPDKFPQ